MNRPTLDLLVELTDAAEQTDAFVTGVVGLASGRLGGDDPEGQSWLARRLAGAGSRFRLGKGTVVEGFGAVYGPEQLRKAAVEARRMVAVLDELRSGGQLPDLVSRLDELGIGRMPEELAALGPASEELRETQQRLSRALAAMRETRTKLLLEHRHRTEGTT